MTRMENYRHVQCVLVLMIAALLATPAFAQGVDADDLADWGGNYGSVGSDAGAAVAVDTLGNVIVAGFFCETIDFGDGPVVSAGASDIFVAKFDGDGDVDGLDFLLWQGNFGDTGADAASAVAVDTQGNVFLAGEFRGNVDFGDGPISCVGGTADIFLAKFDCEGEHLWSIAIGESTDDDFALDLAVDPTGCVILSGVVSGQILLSKCTGEGELLWSKTFGNAGNGQGRGVAVDNLGNIVLVGGFVGTIDFGGGAIVAAGNADIFIAKFDCEGEHLWSKPIGGVAVDLACDVAINQRGGIIVTGEFHDAVDFGDGVINTGGRLDTDGFLAMYDRNGEHIWSRGFPGPGASTGIGVAVNPLGSVAVTGEFCDTTDFGGGAVTSSGETDAFYVEFDDMKGNYNFILEMTGAGFDVGLGIATIRADSVVVTGSFQFTADLGFGFIESEGSDDVFLVKYKKIPAALITTSTP